MCRKLIELHGLKAEELLEKAGQTGLFPVDVAQICYDLDIRLMSFDFKPIEQDESMREDVQQRGEILGAVVAYEDDLAILYRQEDSKNRRRFTIAHELAHCCLHMQPNEQSHIEFRIDSQSDDSREIDANTFAGELLIPKKILLQLIGNGNLIKEESIPNLSKMFMVSENVMKARLNFLKIRVLE